MKVLIILLLIVSSIGLLSCKMLDRSPKERAPIARCVDDLSSIPEVAAMLKGKSTFGAGEPEKNGATNGRPLEGLQVAVTINGMIRSQGDPEAGVDNWCSAENSTENFEKLLTALETSEMPPTVAFVIGKLIDTAHVERWLESGNLVGNMTFTRVKTRKKTAAEFIEDIDRCDKSLAPFLKEHSQRRKYFRYLRLKSGREGEKRDRVIGYLEEKGYVSVPATIDAKDGRFSGMYCAAQARGDATCGTLVKTHFKSLLLDTTLRAVSIAKRRTGHEVKHILMLGANQFTCDTLAEVLAWYKTLGASFITLDEALLDPLYSSVDSKGRPISRAIIRETRRQQLREVTDR